MGVPTWHFGHEPPNAFASKVAKYCSNAVREDALLRICRGGLIYLPGAAGTVQELFQAVTGNYYAVEDDDIIPLVLVGGDYWVNQLPAWPLLESLGKGRMMGTAIALVDTITDGGEWLAAFNQTR